MRIPYLLLVGVGLSSCMHMGMTGETGDNHTEGDSTFEKEIIAGHVRVNVILPPMKNGVPAVLTVRLSLASSGEALSNAKIDMLVGEHSGSEPSGTGEHLEFNASTEAGVYTTTYQAHHAGQYTFAFSITELETGRVDPPIVVEVQRIVAEGEHDHGGTGGMSIYWILGAVVMIGVMVAMMVGRS